MAVVAAVLPGVLVALRGAQMRSEVRVPGTRTLVPRKHSVWGVHWVLVDWCGWNVPGGQSWQRRSLPAAGSCTWNVPAEQFDHGRQAMPSLLNVPCVHIAHSVLLRVVHARAICCPTAHLWEHVVHTTMFVSAVYAPPKVQLAHKRSLTGVAEAIWRVPGRQVVCRLQAMSCVPLPRRSTNCCSVHAVCGWHVRSVVLVAATVS